MADLTCSQCGAEFETPARFCRRCGKSLGVGEPSMSPSEATTRSFDYPADLGSAEPNSTAPTNQWPTSPAYLGPDQMTVGPQYPAYLGANTQGLTRRGSKAPFIILGVLGFILIGVIAVFALIISQMGRGPSGFGGSTAGANAGAPAPPPNVSGHPPIPIPPVPPGPPGAANGASAGPLASLIYPGSKESMNIHGDGEGTIILSTSDPSSKVVDWYVAKLPNADVVTIPFVGGAVITKGQTTVTITPGSPATMIVLATEKKGKQ